MGAATDQIEREIKQTRDRMDGNLGVLEGRAVIAVQPRSELETQRAFEILQQGGPVELRERDLDDQTMEHATAASETPVIVRIGKVLIGQQH